MLDVDEICRAVDEAGGLVIFEVDDIVSFWRGLREVVVVVVVVIVVVIVVVMMSKPGEKRRR